MDGARRALGGSWNKLWRQYHENTRQNLEYASDLRLLLPLDVFNMLQYAGEFYSAVNYLRRISYSPFAIISPYSLIMIFAAA